MNRQRSAAERATAPEIGRSPAANVRRWAVLGIFLLTVAALLQAGPAAAQQWSRDTVRQALLATVLVLVPDNDGNLYASGSGTVMDAAKGMVLTNFHVMGDTDTRELYNQDGLAFIAVNPTELRGSPVIKYAARLLQGSPDLDLAVLQIVGLASDVDAALPQNLGLVTVPRGNSDDLLPGDSVAVIGFPGLGGSTVTFTDGVVAGFLDENDDGVYEWIKTDSEMNPGNSGGLAIDLKGEFIGVPSAGKFRTDVAGKISLIRPSALALDYYDRAVLGQGTGKTSSGGKTGATTTTTRPRTTATPVANSVFGPITFAVEVTDDGQPQDTGNAFVGVDVVYAFFSVSGLGADAEWETRWLLDGQEVLRENQTWDGSDTPLTWVSLSHPDGLPEGEYTLELYTDGRLAQSGSFVVQTDSGQAGVQPVNVTGVVHDADNARKTITGALIVLLNPGVTIGEWVDAEFDNAMVYASGNSARGGKFQLDNKVVPGESYSIVVVHDDYQAVQVDGYEIPADAPDPYELDVAMEKN